jgi:hypothetical protein
MQRSVAASLICSVFPCSAQVDEVIGQLYLFRPEPVAERKFVGVHPACWAAGFLGIGAVGGKCCFSHTPWLMRP